MCIVNRKLTEKHSYTKYQIRDLHITSTPGRFYRQQIQSYEEEGDGLEGDGGDSLEIAAVPEGGTVTDRGFEEARNAMAVSEVEGLEVGARLGVVEAVDSCFTLLCSALVVERLG